jgi:hypothetical protein
VLGRRRALARARVSLYGPGRAGVLLEPADGRWPDHERADRLRLGAGLVAIAANKLPGRWWEPFRDALVAAAEAASGPDAIPGDLVPMEPFGARGFLRVEPWSGEGRAEVVAELGPSAVGPVPVLRKGVHGEGPGFAVAALALLIALAVDADEDGRLALALTVEGLVGWYRDTHRMAAPHKGVTYALEHAVARLDDAGRPVPPDLR